jgi:hypothetical protein
MKRLVGFAGMLLATSVAAGEPVPVAMQSGPITPPECVMAARIGTAGLICESRARNRPAPKLEVTITPPKVKIPDTSKRGTRLAEITVRWSNGEPFRGEVRLTKNTTGICQLAGMELQLSRDLTKAEDATTSVCTVTAIK